MKSIILNNLLSQLYYNLPDRNTGFFIKLSSVFYTSSLYTIFYLFIYKNTSKTSRSLLSIRMT